MGRQGLHLSVTPTLDQQQPSMWEAGKTVPWKGATSSQRNTLTTASLPPRASQQGTEKERR